MILMALDLEMNQPSGRIIEIGVAIGDTETNNVLYKEGFIVNPFEKLNPYITDLTSITEEMIEKEGMFLHEAYEKVKALHKQYQCFINPLTWGGGDSEELKQQLLKDAQLNDTKLEWCFGRRWIDAKTLYVAYRVANSKPLSGGLAKAMTKFDLAFVGRKHRAVDDAYNTFKIFWTLMRKMKDKDAKQ